MFEVGCMAGLLLVARGIGEEVLSGDRMSTSTNSKLAISGVASEESDDEESEASDERDGVLEEERESKDKLN